MANERSMPPDAAGGFRLSNWFWILVIVLIFGVSWWQNRQPAVDQPTIPSQDARPTESTRRSDSSESLPDPDEPQHLPVASDRDNSVRVENQTIRDLNGKVAYKGTVDLTATLDRIERGEANRHRNDGTTFQNREGRLPRKPAGYYKEYVQPTPGENGPGPQRVILGQEGEVWYTPDHYKSFREIRPAKNANRRERGPNPNDP